MSDMKPIFARRASGSESERQNQAASAENRQPYTTPHLRVLGKLEEGDFRRSLFEDHPRFPRS